MHASSHTLEHNDTSIAVGLSGTSNDTHGIPVAVKLKLSQL